MELDLNKYDLTYCTTFFSKFSGLMFSRKKNLIFVLNKESIVNSIVHTFFVFYSINIYWLDKNKNIVDCRLNVRPFSVLIPKNKAKYIVEITS